MRLLPRGLGMSPRWTPGRKSRQEANSRWPSRDRRHQRRPHGSRARAGARRQGVGVPFTLATPPRSPSSRSRPGGRAAVVPALRGARPGVPGETGLAGGEIRHERCRDGDLPVSGKRERDPRNGFVTPYKPNWQLARRALQASLAARDPAPRLPGMATSRLSLQHAQGNRLATAVGRE